MTSKKSADGDLESPLLVATAEEVAETISFYDEQLGLENLILFPAMPGDPYSGVDEQLHRLAEDVLPLV